MPASRQAGARSPFVLSPSSHKRPVRKDRAFVAFPNEAGQDAGTFPIFLDFFLHPCYNNFLSASGGQETRPPFLFVYSCQE